ncbi:hypothetical protein [Desulfoluna limicola]|nr:hypothetical protein [Desulfoluna limicola]
MNQKIFTLALPTETISCYLLLTGLADQNLPLNRREVEALWTGEASELDTALDQLEGKGIIAIPETQDAPLRLLPAEMWRD